MEQTEEEPKGVQDRVGKLTCKLEPEVRVVGKIKDAIY